MVQILGGKARVALNNICSLFHKFLKKGTLSLWQGGGGGKHDGS